MKDKIYSLLQQSWSSVTCSVDLTKATKLLEEYMITEVSQSNNNIHAAKNKEIRQLHRDCDSLELDLENSTRLMEEILLELESYKDIQSNNPSKHQELSNLIYRIEEQIIKNNG